jgi:MYXO-CTERM domain-containing protein
MRRWKFGTAALLACLCSQDAQATYSIAAVDVDRTLVGGAGTSCVGVLNVSVIQGTVPGVGVVHAQAALNEAGRDEAVSLLSMGAGAEEVIAAIASPSFDLSFEQRQYGVVRLPDDAAAFTGSDNGDFAGHQDGLLGPYRYSVQGNILTSENVLDNTKAGFETPAACDMAERLMLALEAGAEGGEGDSRCTDDGIPADSAFLRIVDDQGDELIFIEVTNTFPENPMVPLREQFEAWRVDNPCPDDPGGTEEGGGDGDGDGTTGVETGESSELGTGDEGAGTVGENGGSTATSASSTEGGAAVDGGESSQGCACVADPGGGGGAALGFILLVLGGGGRRRSGVTRKS